MKTSKRPSYKTRDPLGWCGDPRRGSAAGRCTIHDAGKDFNGKLTLKRIRLNGGDYDCNGTYFGGGAGTLPLYWYANDDGSIDAMLRAATREEAKKLIKVDYPKAKFFR